MPPSRNYRSGNARQAAYYVPALPSQCGDRPGSSMPHGLIVQPVCGTVSQRVVAVAPAACQVPVVGIVGGPRQRRSESRTRQVIPLQRRSEGETRQIIPLQARSESKTRQIVPPPARSVSKTRQIIPPQARSVSRTHQITPPQAQGTSIVMGSTAVRTPSTPVVVVTGYPASQQLHLTQQSVRCFSNTPLRTVRSVSVAVETHGNRSATPRPMQHANHGQHTVNPAANQMLQRPFVSGLTRAPSRSCILSQVGAIQTSSPYPMSPVLAQRNTVSKTMEQFNEGSVNGIQQGMQPRAFAEEECHAEDMQPQTILEEEFQSEDRLPKAPVEEEYQTEDILLQAVLEEECQSEDRQPQAPLEEECQAECQQPQAPLEEEYQRDDGRPQAPLEEECQAERQQPQAPWEEEYQRDDGPPQAPVEEECQAERQQPQAPLEEECQAERQQPQAPLEEEHQRDDGQPQTLVVEECQAEGQQPQSPLEEEHQRGDRQPQAPLEAECQTGDATEICRAEDTAERVPAPTAADDKSKINRVWLIQTEDCGESVPAVIVAEDMPAISTTEFIEAEDCGICAPVHVAIEETPTMSTVGLTEAYVPTQDSMPEIVEVPYEEAQGASNDSSEVQSLASSSSEGKDNLATVKNSGGFSSNWMRNASWSHSQAMADNGFEPLRKTVTPQRMRRGRTADLEVKLSMCRKALEQLMLERREHDALTSWSPDQQAGTHPLLERASSLSACLADLAGESLECGCDRDVPGAMDVYEQVNALLDEASDLLQSFTAASAQLDDEEETGDAAWPPLESHKSDEISTASAVGCSKFLRVVGS